MSQAPHKLGVHGADNLCAGILQHPLHPQKKRGEGLLGQARNESFRGRRFLTKGNRFATTLSNCVYDNEGGWRLQAQWPTPSERVLGRRFANGWRDRMQGEKPGSSGNQQEMRNADRP